MPQSIRPLKVNHMNAVVRDFEASTRHFAQVYDAEFMVDIPQKEFHACLLETGRVIFELFVPHDFLVCARYGPHYLGLEWQADMEAVRAAVADHGIGIVRDIGVALHTDPADCFGVSHEFYAGEFHERDWPLLGGTIRSARYWRDDHPLGLTGLKGYTHAVYDLDAASAFLQSFLAAELLFDEARPGIAARALGLRVADIVVEVMAPVGDGALQTHLRRHGQGIYSTVFGVGEIDRARDHLASRGMPLSAGSAEARFAVPPQADLGLTFEFEAV